MEYTHMTNLLSLLQALLTGVGMGVYYDCFRAARRMIRFSAVSVAVQDLFFWVSSAVVLFFLCLYFNNGFIRLYFVTAALFGWLGYSLTAGRLLIAVLNHVGGLNNRIFDFIKNVGIRFLRGIYIKIK